MIHLTIKTAQFGETNGFFETLKDIEDVVRKKGEYHKDAKLRIVHEGKFIVPMSYPASNYFKMNDDVTVVELGDDV